MALDSAKQWDKELGLSGLILTKLDGSAKGGSVVAVSRELGLPVKLVGVGEGMEDLRDVSISICSLVCDHIFVYILCFLLLKVYISHLTLSTLSSHTHQS